MITLNSYDLQCKKQQNFGTSFDKTARKTAGLIFKEQPFWLFQTNEMKNALNDGSDILIGATKNKYFKLNSRNKGLGAILRKINNIFKKPTLEDIMSIDFYAYRSNNKKVKAELFKLEETRRSTWGTDLYTKISQHKLSNSKETLDRALKTYELEKANAADKAKNIKEGLPKLNKILKNPSIKIDTK